MDEPKPVLLVVEDDLDIAEMLTAYFRAVGYEVLTVNWGEDGVRLCQHILPNLVLLDVRLPDIDGFEVARRLRASRKTAHIPIIFATDQREKKDRLHGLQLQADDYVTKPYDVHELVLRVRNSLARAKLQPLSNVITAMPEGQLVDEALSAALRKPGSAYTVATIQNLNKFHEVYGFVAMNELLRAVSLFCSEIMYEPSPVEPFIGHIRPEAFVLISDQENLALLKERLRCKLEPNLALFYSEQHRQAGLFDRQPLGLLFRDVQNRPGGFKSLAELKDELQRLSS